MKALPIIRLPKAGNRDDRAADTNTALLNESLRRITEEITLLQERVEALERSAE